MNITAKYNEHGSIVALIDGQELAIPDDMNNRHRKMIADWEAGGGVIEVYTGPTLSELKSVGKQSVLEFAEQIGAQLTTGYPLVEREAWITKLAEARAIVAGETDPAKYPVIAAEISITGVLANDVAPIIIFKAGLFETASGLISGMRQKTNAAIELASSQIEIDAILDAAKIEAQTALTSLLSGS